MALKITFFCDLVTIAVEFAGKKAGIHVPQYKAILQLSWGLKELPVHL